MSRIVYEEFNMIELQCVFFLSRLQVSDSAIDCARTVGKNVIT